MSSAEGPAAAAGAAEDAFQRSLVFFIFVSIIVAERNIFWFHVGTKCHEVHLHAPPKLHVRGKAPKPPFLCKGPFFLKFLGLDFGVVKSNT